MLKEFRFIFYSFIYLYFVFFESIINPLMATDQNYFMEEHCDKWLKYHSIHVEPHITDLENISYASGILFINIFQGHRFILLGCRAASGEWNIPGGFFEENIDKDLYEAAVRETNEELFFTQPEHKLDKLILENSNSHSIISFNPNKSGKLSQFTMFFANFPLEKLSLINRTLYLDRENEHELKEFQWFLLSDLLDQMYYQKLNLIPEGILVSDSSARILVTCLSGKRKIVLYPELILMLSSCWKDIDELQDWVSLPLQNEAQLLSQFKKNQHNHFLRKNLETTVLTLIIEKSLSPSRNSLFKQNQLIAAVQAHQASMRILNDRFFVRNQSESSKSSPFRLFSYSQTEGFLKIILAEQYKENDLDANIEIFFSQIHDPIYQERFNCPEFSFKKFDEDFQKTIKKIVMHESQSQDFVFLHGLCAELGFFFDFITELYSQLSSETREMVLRPFSVFFDQLQNVASFKDYYDCEKELLPNEAYNYLPGFQRMGLATNFALFGNYEHFGSSTFNYFWQSNSENPPSIYRMFCHLLIELGVPLDLISAFSFKFCHHFLVNDLTEKNIMESKRNNFFHEKNGRLLQIFVSPEIVDEIAYPSVVRGHPLNLRYPESDEKLTQSNFLNLKKTCKISSFLTLLRTAPENLEDILCLNRKLSDELKEEQPFIDQESSPYRATFFNDPYKLKYISLVESRIFLGSKHFWDKNFIKIKTYERFPKSNVQQTEYQGWMSKFVTGLLPTIFTRKSSLSAFKSNILYRFIDGGTASLFSKFSQLDFETGRDKQALLFDASEIANNEVQLSLAIIDGNITLIQKFFREKPENIDQPILTLHLDREYPLYNSSNSNGEKKETFALFVKLFRKFMTPLEFTFQQKLKNSQLIFTLLTLHPPTVESLVKKYHKDIYNFHPYINSPNPLLIRLAYYFYQHKIPFQNLKLALGEPPEKVGNSLESSIFSSYGTLARKQLCNYAVEQGLSLTKSVSIQKFSPMNSQVSDEKSQLETIKFVMAKANENLNVLGYYKRNAFITACLLGYPLVLSYFASSKIDLLQKDELGFSAISYSAASGRREIIDLFIQFPLRNLSLDRKIELIFHSALMCGHLETILYLKQKFASSFSVRMLMYSVSENGQSAYESLVQGFSSALYRYIEGFTDLQKYRDKKGNTLLHLTLEKDSFETTYKKSVQDKRSFVKFLLKLGYDPFKRNNEMVTPFDIFTGSQIWKDHDDLCKNFFRDFVASFSSTVRVKLLMELNNPENYLKCPRRQELTAEIIYNWHGQEGENISIKQKYCSGRPLLNQFLHNEFFDTFISIYAYYKDLSYDKEAPNSLVTHKIQNINLEIYQFFSISPYEAINIPISIEMLRNDWLALQFVSPLSMAITKEHLFNPYNSEFFFFPKLMEHDLDIEIKDSNGLTPLSVACCFGMTEHAKLLLEANADPLAEDYEKRTPLLLAISSDSPNIIDLLVEHVLRRNTNDYIDFINHQSFNGFTPIILASKSGKVECLRRLLESQNQYENAIKKQTFPIKEISLVSPININQRTYKGNSALFFARELAPDICQKVQQLLLDHGAKANDTIMIYALSFNYLEEKLHLLVKHGGNINAKNEHGKSLLILSVSHYLTHPTKKLEKSLKYLIRNGAKIDTNDTNALSIFKIVEEKWAGELLNNILIPAVDFGQDRELLNIFYVPLVINILKGKDNNGLIQSLVENSTNINQPFGTLKTTALMWAMKMKQSNTILFLLKHGASISPHLIHGKTLLMWGVETGDLKVVKQCLQGSYNLEAKNSRTGETALLIAARNNSQDIMHLLIDLGSDVKAIDKYGRNVLMLLVPWFDTFRQNYSTDLGIIKHLLENSVDLNLKTRGVIKRGLSDYYYYNEQLSNLFNQHFLRNSLLCLGSYWKAYYAEYKLLKDQHMLQQGSFEIEQLVNWDSSQPRGIRSILVFGISEHKDFTTFIEKISLAEVSELLPEKFKSLTSSAQSTFILMFDKVKNLMLNEENNKLLREEYNETL